MGKDKSRLLTGKKIKRTLDHIKRYSTYNKLFLKTFRIVNIKKVIVEGRGNWAFMHNGSLNWNDFQSGCFDFLYPNEKCIYH